MSSLQKGEVVIRRKGRFELCEILGVDPVVKSPLFPSGCHCPDEVRRAFRRLGEEHQEILCHRFGMIDGVSLTLKRTMELMGLSLDLVLSLEAQAIQALKSAARQQPVPVKIPA